MKLYKSRYDKKILGYKGGGHDFLIIFVVSFSLLRPVFYWISSSVSRVSDFISFLLVLLLLLFIKRVPPIKKGIVFFLGYLLVMLTSFFLNEINTGLVTIRDLVEIIRPIIYVVFFYFGLAVSFNNYKYVSIHTLAIITLLNSVLCTFMYIMPETFKFLYQIYNVPNLYFHGRPGGIAYTHTEYSALCVIGLICYRILYEKRIISRFYFYSSYLFLMITSIFPMSKAGLIVLLFYVMMEQWIYNKKRSLILLLSLFIILPFALTYLQYFLEDKFPYIYTGFNALLYAFTDPDHITNGSIGPRYNDWLVSINGLSDSYRAFFVGHSPLRVLDISYIEITFPNVLYRFGFLGVFFYYGFYLSLFKKVHTAVFIGVLALLVGDLMANFTESIKLATVTMFLIGVTYKHIESYKIKIKSIV